MSLQLAAAQLTSGNAEVAYKKMGLYRMPYGQIDDRAAAGSLELISQEKLVPNPSRFELPNEDVGAKQLTMSSENNPALEDAVDAVRDVRIAIMNPPFTNRSNMGQKFSPEIQKAIRKRVDWLEGCLVSSDPELEGYVDKNSVAPMFTSLAERCLNQENGVLAIIHPTIALTATSSKVARRILANRFHIHTLLTCHQPKQVNLSQNTGINESMIIARRHNGPKPPTRIINLDKFPMKDDQVAELHDCILSCESGLLPNDWGEIFEWPAERVSAGDWSAAVWRSPALAEAAFKIANDGDLPRVSEQQFVTAETGRILRGQFKATEEGTRGGFPIIKSKGADGQTRIQAVPDEYWISKKRSKNSSIDAQAEDRDTEKMMQKAGHILVTAGQGNSSARLTAVAAENKFVGNGWIPISGMTAVQAKAAAVFLNSTAGRLQLMRNPGRSLFFPIYSAAETANIRIPDLLDEGKVRILAACWEATKSLVVPQYRDGECEVRQLWDEAVAKALDWDAQELTKLRLLLHKEPHVREVGYGQYGKANEED